MGEEPSPTANSSSESPRTPKFNASSDVGPGEDFWPSGSPSGDTVDQDRRAARRRADRYGSTDSARRRGRLRDRQDRHRPCRKGGSRRTGRDSRGSWAESWRAATSTGLANSTKQRERTRRARAVMVDRDRERRERYDEWCSQRAAERIAELREPERRRLIDERLQAVTKKQQFYLQLSSWSEERKHEWLTQQILQDYGTRKAPSYEEWCRQHDSRPYTNPYMLSNVGSAVSEAQRQQLPARICGARFAPPLRCSSSARNNLKQTNRAEAAPPAAAGGLAIPRPGGRSRLDQRSGGAAAPARFARSPQIRAEWLRARLRPRTNFLNDNP